jgi:hypothetical protein
MFFDHRGRVVASVAARTRDLFRSSDHAHQEEWPELAKLDPIQDEYPPFRDGPDAVLRVARRPDLPHDDDVQWRLERVGDDRGQRDSASR